MTISSATAANLARSVWLSLKQFGILTDVKYHIYPSAGMVALHIKPGHGVSVRSILAKADDIQLAAGVESARVNVDHLAGAVVAELSIEPPPILYTSALLGGAEPYCMVLGKRVDGTFLKINIQDAATPHVLIAGTTGAGKSALWQNALATICHATPGLQVLTYDPIHDKMPWVARYLAGHVLGQANKPGQMIKALQWACDLMDKGRKSSEGPILICIDEVKDLLDVAPDIEPLIVRLATRGRNHAIHLVLATQNPSAQVLSANLVACMPVRVVLSVVRDIDSRTASGGKILDAHKLPKRGVGMLASGDKVVRFTAGIPDNYEMAQARGAATVHEDAPAQEPLPIILRSPTPDRAAIRMQRDFALPALASPKGETGPLALAEPVAAQVANALQTIEQEPAQEAGERPADSYTLAERVALIYAWNPSVSVSALQNALRPGGAQNGFAVVTQLLNELKARASEAGQGDEL